MKASPIPVKFDRQGHSCDFHGGLGLPSNAVELSGSMWELAAGVRAPYKLAGDASSRTEARLWLARLLSLHSS